MIRRVAEVLAKQSGAVRDRYTRLLSVTLVCRVGWEEKRTKRYERNREGLANSQAPSATVTQLLTFGYLR